MIERTIRTTRGGRCAIARLAFIAVALAVTAAAHAQTGGLLRPPGRDAVEELPKVPALVIEQIRREPSGRGAERRVSETRQVMIVDLKGEKLYMADFEAAGNGKTRLKQHILLRMDGNAPRVYRISADGRFYTEHTEDLNELQKERRIAEMNEIKRARRMTRRERDRWFADNCHLRPDRKRIVTVETSPGETILNRVCKRLVVKENCLTVIDAQIAEDIPGAKNYYHLFRRLGVFSDEVLEKIEGAKGVPLKAKITVVTALPRYDLEAEVKSLVTREVPSAFFELPPNAEELKEGDGPVACQRCKKTVDSPDSAVRFAIGGNVLYFCGDRCAETFMRERNRGRGAGNRPPPRSSPAPPKR